jgi:putative salt-induced outer membrane protein YdiY
VPARIATRAFIAVLLVSTACHADKITLKNGDRITGAITSSDGKTLSVKTDYAGDLTIKWDSVESVSSDQPMYVSSKDGKMVVGTIKSSDKNLEVATAHSGTVIVSRDSVQTVRSESEQKAYGAWGGVFDSGLSLARGNADTTTFTIGAHAARTTDNNKASAFVTSIYSQGRTNGISLTTASAVNAGLRYDFNLNPRTFGFVFTDFDHDRFQQLDLRNVIGGGVGRHVIKNEATTFDVYAGASFNQEFFSTLTRRSAEVLAGEEFDKKLSSAFSIKEKLEFYPNLSSIGDYRMVFDTAAITKLSKVLSWQFDVSDRYLSNPILGLKGNDLLLTTGLRVTLGSPKGI